MRKTKIPTKYLLRIRQLLKAENFSDEQIWAMTDKYLTYDDKDKRRMLENDEDDFHDFLEKIPDKVEDRIKAIQKDPYLKNNYASVNHVLKRANISMAQAKSICSYSNYHNTEILSIKRNNNDKDIYVSRITDILRVELQIKAMYTSFTRVDKVFGETIEFVKELNPLSPRSSNLLIEHLKAKNLQGYRNLFLSYLGALKDYYKYLDIIGDMDEALKNAIPYNTCVYRGVSESFIMSMLNRNDDYASLVKKHFSEDGYLSTSLTFLSSFAKEKRNFCLKIYVPKGSEGLDITPFSFNRQEYEILLNSCDLYFIDFYVESSNQYDGIETQITNKPTLVAFLLSKNRECYKDIGVKKNKNIDEHDLED